MTGARFLFPLFLMLFLVLPAVRGEDRTLPALKVSDNKRFLVTSEGKPFFYLGDTAWELFHRLNREDVDRYLEKLRPATIYRHSSRGDRRV